MRCSSRLQSDLSLAMQMQSRDETSGGRSNRCDAQLLAFDFLGAAVCSIGYCRPINQFAQVQKITLPLARSADSTWS
jgi:hypothetical protein